MYQADVVIVGGGLSGCMAAARAAEAGLKAVLVEKREYPGREIAAYNHTFASTAGEERFNRECPMWLARLFTIRNELEVQTPDGLARQWLIDELGRLGVIVLYSAVAVGISRDEAGVTGVILATPLGIMHLAARKVLDATERLNLGRIVSGHSYANGPVKVNSIIEIENMKGIPQDFSAVENELGLIAGSVRLHATLRKDTHLIEFAYMDQADEPYGARSGLEIRRISKSWQLSSCLRERVSGFELSRLSHLAYDALLTGDEAEFPSLEGFGRLASLPWGFSLDDVAEAWLQAKLAAEWAGEPASFRRGEEQLIIRGAAFPFNQEELPPYEDDGLPILLRCVAPESLADSLTFFEADVCVVGCGAGGGMAMLAAAESGKRVAAIEVHFLLGGTHTVGRVIDYYDGYRSGMSRLTGERAGAFAQAGRAEKEQGGIPYASFLNHCMDELGVIPFTGSIACGALLDGKRVNGALVANENGLFAVKAHVTIDATGNADMIAFAGVPYEIGDPQTGMVQSYSFWGMELYSVASHLQHRYLNDRGICHPDLYSERLRAVRDGHFRNSPFHLTPMVTVRESRRMDGEHCLMVRDLLDDKTYEDVIAVSCTRADSHAYTSSPLARLGGLGEGKEIKVRIPYGCFIPRGIEGLLVGAKAISGERDATSFCRMNADIKNAGYAIGMAASMAAEGGTGVRNIDLPALQQKLRNMDILPDWAFAVSQSPAAAELAARTAAGDERALLALLRRPAEHALPLLEQLYEEGAQGYTVHALAWFGSPLGGGQLAEVLAEAVEKGRHRTLPMQSMYNAMFRWGRDYGDDYTLVNRLIMFAGRSGDDRPVEPLARLIADTEGYGPLHPWIMIYDYMREDMVRYPFFNRMLNIAAAAAERADKRLAPAMDALLSREGITGYAVPLGSRDHSCYMLAHAEVSLARAAVHCGSELGAKVLETYLDDVHSFFRKTARRELDKR